MFLQPRTWCTNECFRVDNLFQLPSRFPSPGSSPPLSPLLPKGSLTIVVLVPLCRLQKEIHCWIPLFHFEMGRLSSSPWLCEEVTHQERMLLNICMFMALDALSGGWYPKVSCRREKQVIPRSLLLLRSQISEGRTKADLLGEFVSYSPAIWEREQEWGAGVDQLTLTLVRCLVKSNGDRPCSFSSWTSETTTYVISSLHTLVKSACRL